MYIPSRTTLAAVPPDSVARSEDMWRYRTAGMHRSACLVACKAGLRGSGWHGWHAALVVQCAVGVVLHPRRRPCAIRMRRTQLMRFPEKVYGRRCARRLIFIAAELGKAPRRVLDATACRAARHPDTIRNVSKVSSSLASFASPRRCRLSPYPESLLFMQACLVRSCSEMTAGIHKLV